MTIEKFIAAMVIALVDYPNYRIVITPSQVSVFKHASHGWTFSTKFITDAKLDPVAYAKQKLGLV